MGGSRLESVLFGQEGSVATVTLNRPEVYNALNFELGSQLTTALERCQADASVRVVVITGAGRGFCGGGDLKAASAYSPEDPSRFFRELTKHFHRLVTDIRLLPKPVLAAVNGPAGGAGVSLALACDLRIASEAARFKQAYTSNALVPDGGWTAFAPLIVGLGRASEMVFLDPVIDAQRALEIGLVNQVVPAENFAAAVKEVATRLAAGPTLAFARAKALLNASLLPALEAQLERERQAISASARTRDFTEGLAAFLAKRPPDYAGK